MAKIRSPNYPAVGLPEAIRRARMIWTKETHGRMPQEAAVKHMGYNTMNGASMGVVSALRKYGLLEGEGEALRLSADALTILHDPLEAPTRKQAIWRAAFAPSLFKDIHEEHGDHIPSEESLRSSLLKRGFIPAAADAANRAYRETMALVAKEAAGYNGGAELVSQDPDGGTPMQTAPHASASPVSPIPPPAVVPLAAAAQGYKQDTFSLDEGEAVVRWPEGLSRDSFEDFKAWLELVLRKVQRSVVSE